MWPAIPRSTSISVRTGPPAFVGREPELDAVVEVLRHRPAAVLIEGEPGMGRTRLLAELARHREFAGGRVLAGACQRFREPFPYGPVLEALRSAADHAVGPLSPVAGVLRPLLPELAEILPPQPDSLPSPGAERHRVFRAIRELLGACGPALLLVDDLHWADEDTCDLLRFLATAMPAELALVVAYRSPLRAPIRVAPTVHTARVSLGPLDARAVRQLAAELLENPGVTEEFATRLRECTTGIPFVVEETLRALHDTEDRPPTGELVLDSLEVPAALRETITERLAALPGAAARLVRAAAVLGIEAEAPLLGELAGLTGETLRPALLAALTGDLLADLGEGRYGFRHPLARKAVRDTVDSPERTILHTESVRLLATRPAPPLRLLAQHARAAGDVGRWRRYAEAAAGEAIAHGEPVAAVELLRDVLADPGESASGLARTATKLSEVTRRGFHPGAITTLDRVLRRPLDTDVRGVVRLSLGALLARTTGGLCRGRAELERAVAELGDRPDLAAHAALLLARPHDGLTPLSWHEEWRRRAEELAAGTSNPELLRELTAARIATAACLGDPAAWPEFQRLPATDADHLRGDLTDAMIWAGHLQRAERLPAGQSAETHSIRLRLDWLLGRWSGLTEKAGKLLSGNTELAPVVAETALVLGNLAAVRGEFVTARQHLAATKVHEPSQGRIPLVLAAAATLVAVLLATDDVDAACRTADDAMDSARHKGIWVWAAALVPTAAEAYTRAGRWPDADTVVEEFARGVGTLDAPIATAALAAGRATLLSARGKYPAAAVLFDEAAAAYERLPMPYLATGARERAALNRLKAGHRDTVADLAATATTYECLGATRDAGRCRHVLREHGAWAPSQRGRRGYGRELSPREREVAGMLAEGRTNREIADGLFLSPRTVEQHVAKVLRKLGARSRTDVARRLTATGGAAADALP
ncbi:ATP-binding protein [Amycolatopsis sp. NPDC059027]|uniref:ATP-binding protein n=1 Tax=unclassified Amycolatopsis TaxID=2618356 RepID=UPI00366D84E3